MDYGNSAYVLIELEEDALRYCPNYQPSELNLSSLLALYVRISCDDELICICRAARNLCIILLKSPHCSNHCLSAIGRHCTVLVVLKIDFQTEEGLKRIDTGLVSIANGCPGLDNLEIHNCRSLTDVGLTAVATYCRKLSVL